MMHSQVLSARQHLNAHWALTHARVFGLDAVCALASAWFQLRFVAS